MNRTRWALVATAAVTALTASVVASASATAETASRALPKVSMASVLVQAQVEPKYGNQRALGGDGSVKRVQRALSAEGIRTPADGNYGEGTTASYRAWQHRLGYRGMDANGLPGITSLRRLGKGRFTVVDEVDVGRQCEHYRGSPGCVSTRTKAMLMAADDMLPRWDFTVVQGGYCFPHCAPESAHTHDGGGVADISVAGLSPAQRWQQVKALRAVGFAAWLRTPAQGFSYHIHAVAVADTDLWQGNGSTQVRNQVGDYFAGHDGLASDGPDNTPSAYRVKFTWWERRRT
jgi:peptidoglycan hydrolase-like protein with peptidoglycan-binding domain